MDNSKSSKWLKIDATRKDKQILSSDDGSDDHSQEFVIDNKNGADIS